MSDDTDPFDLANLAIHWPGNEPARAEPSPPADEDKAESTRPLKNGGEEPPAQESGTFMRPLSREARERAKASREANRERAKADRTTKGKGEFIRVPINWPKQLKGASGSVVLFALHLLRLRFKEHGHVRDYGCKQFKVTSAGLPGLSRKSKWRALRDLERRGLIAVECERGRNPMVTIVGG